MNAPSVEAILHAVVSCLLIGLLLASGPSADGSPEPNRGVLSATASVRDRQSDKPTPAQVRVDGVFLKKTTPFEHSLTPGRHEIEFLVPGLEPVVKTIEIRAGQTTVVHGQLSSLTPEELARLQEQEAELSLQLSQQATQNSLATRRTTGIWLGVGGGAMTVAGAVLVALAHNAAGRARDSTNVSDLDDAVGFAQTAQTSGWITASVGLSASVAGAVLYLLSREPSDDTNLADPEAGW